jgi:phosphoribosylformylglycinamidine synthase
LDTVSIVNLEDNFEFSSKNIEKFGLKPLLLDQKQTKMESLERYENFANQPYTFTFPSHFDGKLPVVSKHKPTKAAIIREKK